MGYRDSYCLFVALLLSVAISGQVAQSDTFFLLKPDRVFDGEQLHEGWQVLVKNGKIETAGNIKTFPKGTTVINLKGCTLLPGLIEGHSHLFLHPYNETNWDDQVLNESRAERVARAVNHARATLAAGFTTMRDLGTEGAGYDDVGLKRAIKKGVVPGPHLLVAGPAIVATGGYGPRSESPDVEYPYGAVAVGNSAELNREIRTQAGKGVDIIKIYADYHWGPDDKEHPTFTLAELTGAVEIANSSGRQVVAHASTPEGMRRAVLAGVSTIEHGDDGTPEVFRLMKEKGVALCPTLTAGEAVLEYKGWKKGVDTVPQFIRSKKQSFAAALAAGVTICMGGDAGVFTHGDNAREMELMVEYGMKPLDVLRSATSVNADVFGLSDRAGRIQPGLPADLVAVEGNPVVNISVVRKVKMVMKEGIVVNAE